MDELVAYAKKLYGANNLPAGTFDNFIIFIQEITEAARASKNSLVVASIPESDIEIGGDAGKIALATIEHTFGRMESIWKPVAANEGFEKESFKPRLLEQYDIATDCLLFDNTNFYTYVDTSNSAALPKLGHCMQKRNDLKIIGLSMMVSPDHNIPLFHEAYPGNTNDAKRFSEVLSLLKERYRQLGHGQCRVTLVFDKGNNNEENIERLLSEESCAFHYELLYYTGVSFSGSDTFLSQA